jgi:hypothetical protein
MKNSFINFKIVLPSIICFLLIRIAKIPFSFYPLSFGLIIGIINWNVHKYNPYLGAISSVIISYTAFYIAYFSFVITGGIVSFMGDSGSVLGLTISTYVIAPILVFLFYKFIFKMSNSKLTMLIVIISIFVLVLQNYFFYSNELNKESLNSFTAWQIVMALALQLIIYQKEIFKTKKASP